MEHAKRRPRSNEGAFEVVGYRPSNDPVNEEGYWQGKNWKELIKLKHQIEETGFFKQTFQHTDLRLHRKTINKLPPLYIPDQADSNSGDP